MINRYQGNSGRVERIDEQAHQFRPRPAQEKPRMTEDRPQRFSEPRPLPRQRPAQTRPGGITGSLHGLLEGLGRLLPGGHKAGGVLAGLETEDVILLLVLYLMYRESGDSELLMIMGAMFLL